MNRGRRRLVAVALVMLASSAGTAQARTFSLQTQMFHQIGEMSGHYWRASCGDCGIGVHATYGPYATDLPAYQDIIAATSFYAMPTVNKTLTWTLDLVNGSSVLKTLNFSRAYGNPHAQYVAFIPFTVAPQHNIQVRTRLKGDGTLDQCRTLELLTEAQKIQEVRPAFDQAHQIGRQWYYINEPGWIVSHTDAQCVNTGCRTKFLSYGPYWDLPQVTRYWVAAFRLGFFQPPSPFLPGDAEVAKIDVTAWKSDGSQEYVVAEKVIKVSDFDGNGVMTLFPMNFLRLSYETRFQYRVRLLTDRGTLAHSTTKIYLPESGCSGP